ncbi:glycosyltransferase family 90 protein [Bombardia bombarda]|uniref:Glycosyltransferase family 90 protein n=1 Tax=Bombardia bombarda TaxID=252184 RepID=A0AA39X9W3_9PEZI|nr:glycosyltransferase family 90 protein [Bombardia bombarda]
MASSGGGSQLAALCAVASFLWLSHNLEGHQLIEHPRLSSLLVLLTSGIASFATSFFALRLPGANGRFDDELEPLRAARVSLPKKPRRYFLPILVVCIILRLELFHRVTLDLQCSSPGIESFFPLVILFYELLPGRRARPEFGIREKREEDDLSETLYDALGYWISGWLNDSKLSLTVVTIALTLGTHLASSQNIKSTFFCSNLDRSSLVIAFQWAGLLMDGIIAILAWRILAWARTTKSRLKTLSGIFLTSSVGTGLLYGSFRLFHPSEPMSYNFKGLDSLYVFDVMVDGLTFSTFFISTTLLVTEGSPLSLVGIITFLSGLLATVQNTRLIGTWENVSPFTTYTALVLVCFGFSFFAYANNLRSVALIRRGFVVFLLLIVVITATIFTLFKSHNAQLTEHPVQRLIYSARVESDRWALNAAVSNSLPVAVREYKERHNGRDPPPKFDVWYRFASEHKSPILDHFTQIENDILPFWGVASDKIRADIRRIAAEPGIALVKIQDGTPSHTISAESPHQVVLDDFVDMIKAFSNHLPNMELAINLNDRPRILAPWEDVNRFTAVGVRTGLSELLSKRSQFSEDKPSFDQPLQSTDLDKALFQKNFTSVRAFREMTALTCPPGTKTRSAVHWDIRNFCAPCARPQSQGSQFLADWDKSQSLCHQSDMLRLHGFHMTSPELRPLQELLPVFSRSKTDSYSDILIPLRQPGNDTFVQQSGDFAMKETNLFWRGNVHRDHSWPAGHELLHGGHWERLVHLVNNASGADRTTVLVPTPGTKDNSIFAYEQVSTAELNALLPIDIKFSSYSACKDTAGNCDSANLIAQTDFTIAPPPTKDEKDETEPALRHKEWHSERLMPWIHFVPVDMRFHALHSTLAYFSGIVTKKPKKPKNSEGVEKTPPALLLGGREVVMSGHMEDARWIAERGKQWAAKALRREDMEVYLFRLLLEWGRLLDDKRGEVGFVL